MAPNRGGSPTQTLVPNEHTTAYQTAVQMMLYEGNVLWARLNAMVVLNALLIASATLLVEGGIHPGVVVPS